MANIVTLFAFILFRLGGFMRECAQLHAMVLLVCFDVDLIVFGLISLFFNFVSVFCMQETDRPS